MSNNSRRSQIFLAKALVLSAMGLFVGLLVTGFSVLCYRLGLELRDANLPPQDFNLLTQLLRVSVYCVIYSMFTFLLTLLVRSIVGAIVIFLTLPAIVEPLLGILLKENASYLPISTFDQIMGVSLGVVKMSPNTAMLVSGVYILALALIAWVSFMKRDASSSSS